MEELVYYLTQFILFFGLYFSIFWFLVLLNSKFDKDIKIKNYPSVSILIPAYNEESGIEKTIKSCLNLKYKGKLEIIVINDCSTDDTLNIAEKYKDKIIVVDKKKNGGKAAAINSGLEYVKSDFIGVVDADSEVNYDSLQISMKYFFQKDSDKVGAVISKMKPENESNNILERVQLIEYMLVGLIRSLSASLRLLHLTPGVLSIYRTNVIRKLKGFDSNNLTEDFEIGVRVRKLGYMIEYAHRSTVFTTTPSSFKIFLKQRIRWSRGFIQTHKKHKDIFFNSKHGLFGMYQFPMNVLGPIVYFLAIYLISFKIYKELYEFAFKLFNAPDTIDWFYFDSLKDILLTVDPKIDFLILFSFLLLIMMIYGVIRFYEYNFFKKQSFKKIWALVIYIMIYNYIYIYVWIISVIREIRRESYDWGTKK